MPLQVERVCDHSFVAQHLAREDIVLDLGMNQGEFSSWIVAHTPARVCGVEPVPSLFNQLPRHERIKKLQVAIGAKPGRQIINVYANYCASVIDGIVAARPEESVAVDVVDLAGVMRAFGIDTVALLKLDIEGAEIDMFSSASIETLRKIDQMTIEFHDFLKPEQKSDVVKIYCG